MRGELAGGWVLAGDQIESRSSAGENLKKARRKKKRKGSPPFLWKPGFKSQESRRGLNASVKMVLNESALKDKVSAEGLHRKFQPRQLIYISSSIKYSEIGVRFAHIKVSDR